MPTLAIFRQAYAAGLRDQLLSRVYPCRAGYRRNDIDTYFKPPSRVPDDEMPGFMRHARRRRLLMLDAMMLLPIHNATCLRLK